jgi:cephalosporin-C deacetylase-like acetyl esterase
MAVRDSTGIAFLPDGYRVTDVTLVSDNGFQARARVRSPNLQDGLRRPAVIMMGGYKSGRAVVEIPDSAGGLVMASVEYPHGLRSRPRGIAWLWRFAGVRRAMLDTPPAILLLAQYLYTREDVDPDRVTIVGASFGAPFAVAAAATDRRIAGVALVHGGGDFESLVAGALSGSVPAWTVPFASRGIALGLAPLEPTKYAAAIAPRPLLMLNATDDETIPRESVLALYHAARRPKRLVWSATRHVSRSERGVIEELLNETLVWMRDRGLR